MLGSVLIQPQMLARMQGRNDAEELVDEMLALAQILVLNPRATEAVLPAFEAAAQGFGTALTTRIEPRLPQALTELRALLEPFVAPLARLGEGDTPASPAALLERLADGLDGAAVFAGALSDAQIRALARRLDGIVTGTLGLTQADFSADFRAMLADVRARLRAGNAAMTNDAAAVREALACLLARLDAAALPRLPQLDLHPDRLAELVIRWLRDTPAPAVLGHAGCLIERVGAVLRAVAELARGLASGFAAPTVSVGGSLGGGPIPRGARDGAAAPPRDVDGRYCWYASWLYATRGHGFFQHVAPGYPNEEIWLSKDGRQLVRRRPGDDDVVLHSAETPFQWYQAPQFAGPPSTEHFSFGAISPGFLEDWAFVTAVLAKGAAGMWHAVAMGMSPQEYACNIPLWLWNWADMTGRAAAGAPLPSEISRSLGWGVGSTWLFSALAPMLMVFGGSFEGVHTRTTAGLGFLQWLTLIGGDALSAYKIAAITHGVRDISLSLFTLINQTGAGTPPALGDDLRPKNWDMGGPIIGLVNLLIGLAFQAMIPRDDYGLPFDNNGALSASPLFFPWLFPAAPLANAFGNMLGTFVAWSIARTATPAQLGEKVGIGALVGLLTFILEFYTTKEGGTDGGRYNPRIDPNGNPYTVPPRVDFPGYPDKADSPYRLPYAADTAMYVGQANLGFFSHMRFNGFPQIYAYDFAHDFGDEILAVRDGTVVDFFDWIPDNIDPTNAQAAAARTASNGVMGGAGWRGDTPTWNFITIRHDTAVGGHDRDQGGAAVTTYATYGHGATGGVRTLWQNVYGRAPNQIIGARVVAGNPIMQAGSTGVSFHNHLHLHVQGGPAAPAPVPGPAVTGPNQLVGPGALTPYTLPFVFSDAPGDGVLKYLTWYRSANARTTTLPP